MPKGKKIKRWEPINPGLDFEAPDKFGLTESERLAIIAENNRRGLGHLLHANNEVPLPARFTKIEPKKKRGPGRRR